MGRFQQGRPVTVSDSVADKRADLDQLLLESCQQPIFYRLRRHRRLECQVKVKLRHPRSLQTSPLLPTVPPRHPHSRASGLRQKQPLATKNTAHGFVRAGWCGVRNRKFGSEDLAPSPCRLDGIAQSPGTAEERADAHSGARSTPLAVEAREDTRALEHMLLLCPDRR